MLVEAGAGALAQETITVEGGNLISADEADPLQSFSESTFNNWQLMRSIFKDEEFAHTRGALGLLATIPVIVAAPFIIDKCSPLVEGLRRFLYCCQP